MPKDTPQMTANDVIEIVQLFSQNHIGLHIDGGWAVDALLGEQTRVHSDLDIAVQHKNIAQIRALLEARGYRDVPRDDTWDCNFVLGDDQGHQIDIHSYTFDPAGNHIFGVAYPLDSLTGIGSVNGQPVKCISPEWLVKFHTGYRLDENDYHDVKALCQRFGIKMPVEYDAFELAEAAMTTQIRCARLTDAPALAALLRSIGWFARMADEPETATQQTVTRHLEACLGSPSHSVYVAADSDDRPVGYAAVHWLPYLFLSGPEGFVSDLFVAASARGHGAGRALLRAIEEEATARGCSRLHLINFRNRESYQRRFYEKAGWEERPNDASFVRQLKA